MARMSRNGERVEVVAYWSSLHMLVLTAFYRRVFTGPVFPLSFSFLPYTQICVCLSNLFRGDTLVCEG